MKDKPADIRELLTAASIAAYREQVIEECALAAESYDAIAMRDAGLSPISEEIAAAIRALKERR